jgi:hypothetical protein
VHDLASAQSRLGTEQATVPRIVLPIRSGGLELTDQVCWAILGAAMVVAAALILYLNRGTVFFVDELERFVDSPTLRPVDVIEPHAGHLTAISNLVYKAILETVGAHYLAFRLLIVSCVLLTTGLFYALVKRRIGALPALAPALVLLFFGSSWQMIITGLGFNVVFSIAMGLGALLALDRGDRLGDALACVLLVVSVSTLSIGLAFLVGVAVSVLLGSDRRRRAWIFLVPLTLYTVWWLWGQSAPEPSGSGASASNVLLIPSYIAESLAAVLSSLAGLSFEFSRETTEGAVTQWGIVLAIMATVALALRIRQGSVPRFLWVSLAIVLAFWTLSALARNEFRPPGQIRYLYTGAVGVLLVAAAAASGTRFSRAGVATLFAVSALSLATNLVLLRDGAREFRNAYSAPLRANLAMLELGRDDIRPGFNPRAGVQALSISSLSAAEYLAASDRYGSLAFSLPELANQPEPIRQRADRTLARALGVGLEPSRSRTGTRECELVKSGSPGGAIAFPLPPGGATLTTRGDAPGEVTVGRFATAATVDLGALQPGRSAMLRIPTDSSPTPWRASVTGQSALLACGPPPPSAG